METALRGGTKIPPNPLLLIVIETALIGGTKVLETVFICAFSGETVLRCYLISVYPTYLVNVRRFRFIQKPNIERIHLIWITILN